jgi:hypothetical protein
VTPAFEGWFRNPDGSFSLLVDINRNQAQEVDVPIGTDNRIEPGGPDMGQPTHFRIGRQWGMFVLKVPSNFAQQRLTWTLVANGQSTSIPFYLHPDYEIAPMQEAAVGNTPPVVSFDERGPSVQGPLAMTVQRTTTVAKPLTLTAWVRRCQVHERVGPAAEGSGPVTITWTKYRGPGAVKFDIERPKFEAVPGQSRLSGKAVTTVTFSEPGDYMLHATMNDSSAPAAAGFSAAGPRASSRFPSRPEPHRDQRDPRARRSISCSPAIVSTIRSP